jgi:hypothetical protein
MTVTKKDTKPSRVRGKNHVVFYGMRVKEEKEYVP